MGLQDFIIWGIILFIIAGKAALIIFFAVRSKRKQQANQLAMRQYIDSVAKRDAGLSEMPEAPAE
jgi:hypothetical protein